ncbi:tetratricopeptide repeat protein [Candidatus Uhrbacteria bacterium]|nr:tetratricopeptide repeat protein [Candidatus Uhrbacteria bacterium]
MAYSEMRVEETSARVTRRRATTEQKEQWSGLLDTILEWSFIGLVFLMPLFFLPFTTEALELNKQMLLFVGALWLGLVYTTKIVVTGKIELKRSPLGWGMLALLAAWILATVFSLYPYNSILGLDRQEFLSLATLIAALVFTFILGNNGTPRTTSRLLYALLISTALVTVEGLLQLFGVALLPWDFTKTTSFNTVGLFSLWGVLGVTTLVLATNEIIRLSLSDGKQKSMLVTLLALFTALHLILLIIFNDATLWLSLAVGLVISLAVLYLKLPENQKVSWLILPSFMIVFSITLMFVSPPRFVSLPLVATPSLQTSFDITVNTLKSSPAFGYGPGTFLSSYTQFRPKEMNGANLFDLWSARFDQSSSYLLTKIAATGFVGLLAILFMAVLVFWQVLTSLKKKELGDDSLMLLSVVTALSSMGVAAIFKPSNMTLTFVWWLLMALIYAYTARSGKEVMGGQSNRFVILSSLALYTLVALGFVGIFFAGTRYSADLAFADALLTDRKLSAEAQQKGEPVSLESTDAVINAVAKAIQIDPRNNQYARTLSQALLAKLSRLIGAAKTQEDATAALQTLPSQAVAAANGALALNPKDIKSILNAAGTYQSLLPFTADAVKLASETYAKAVEVDPTNPQVRFDLGRMYVDEAVLHKQRAGNEKASEESKAKEKEAMKKALEMAEKYLKEALDLKPDFAPAHFHLATIRAEQGNKEEALNELDTAAVLNARLAPLRSADESLFYLTGLAYASLDEKDRASSAFKAAFTLRPNYALALWNYSILQAAKGNKDEAIKALEQILQYDKENKTVKDKLAELQGGAPSNDKGNAEENK